LEERSAFVSRELEQVTAEAAIRIEQERFQRLLPLDKTMEKVVTYETHLSRELQKALRELEAMQARRQGRTAPLARLDVSGVPDESGDALLPKRRTR
jgi:hypothetical protein